MPVRFFERVFASSINARLKMLIVLRHFGPPYRLASTTSQPEILRLLREKGHCGLTLIHHRQSDCC
jgi:hypothetical protein